MLARIFRRVYAGCILVLLFCFPEHLIEIAVRETAVGVFMDNKIFGKS